MCAYRVSDCLVDRHPYSRRTDGAPVGPTGITNGYSRLSWAVLDWNSPAIATYDAIGGKQMSEWISYRCSGSELSALAGSELSAPAESVE